MMGGGTSVAFGPSHFSVSRLQGTAPFHRGVEVGLHVVTPGTNRCLTGLYRYAPFFWQIQSKIEAQQHKKWALMCTWSGCCTPFAFSSVAPLRRRRGPPLPSQKYSRRGDCCPHVVLVSKSMSGREGGTDQRGRGSFAHAVD